MKKTARQRVFEALYRAGDTGCTTGQLCQPTVGGVRFGARIKELRDEGARITATLVRPGSHLYVLDRESLPAPESAPPTAPSPTATVSPPPVVGGAESGALFTGATTPARNAINDDWESAA